MSAASPSGRRRGRALAAAGEVPPAIQWHEGMLLAPQHFQWSALRQEALLHYHALAISPFHWGVRHLEIDPALLVDGLFRVKALEAVMPDGLLAVHTADRGPDLALDLTPHAETMRQRPLRVYLAVAGRHGAGLLERYESREETVPDQNTGDGDLEVPVLRPRLQLLAGDEPPQKFACFPLAEVELRDEVFSRTRFEPPWLRVAPGSALYELCLGVAARLRDKAAFLAEQVRAPSTAARVPQLLETKAMVQCLVGALPPFEAVLRTGVSHPFPLYVALCGLLGQVAGLGRSLVPPALEPYDHNDLTATYEQARAAVSKALDEGIHEAYTAYPFALEEGEFRLLFDPDWATRSLILGVRAGYGVAEADAAAWVAASLVGARSKIRSLRDRRITGARRKRIEADADLVPARGVTLYSLSVDPEHVVPGEELTVLNPADERRRPAEIVLYVRNRT